MHTLPSLPYDYAALEPYIDEATMRLHHTKHHQTYIDKLNAALESEPSLAERPLADLLRNLDLVPEAIRTAVRNHGGGHWNHSFFWQILRAGQDGNAPDGELADLINKQFGDLPAFQSQFKERALSVFGSGWTWLVKKGDSLEIMDTGRQDTPLATSAVPLLGLDVWEHAYYLKYQNRRADYIDNFWPVVNWEQVAANLAGNQQQ
jgi:superoxide dismutase, Fe-Mn family